MNGSGEKQNLLGICENPLYSLSEFRDLASGTETPQLDPRGRVYWPTALCGHTGNTHLLGVTGPIAASLSKLKKAALGIRPYAPGGKEPGHVTHFAHCHLFGAGEGFHP